MNNWNLLQAPTKTWQQKPPYRTRLRADWKNNFQPKGLWAFNEAAGNTAFDISGNGNNGTLNGGVTWANGLTFDGSTGKCTANAIPSLNSASACTIAIHAKRNVSSAFGGLTQAASSSAKFGRTGIGLWNDGNVYFQLESSSANTYGFIAQNDLLWHWYVAVFDGSQSGNAARLKGYIDGQQKTLSFSGPIAATTANNAGGILSLGQQIYNGFQFGKSSIDFAEILPVAATASQILSLYTDPYQMFAPTLGEQGVVGVSQQGGPFPWFDFSMQGLCGLRAA